MSDSWANCIICGKSVRSSKHTEHLEIEHPPKRGPWYDFYVDEKLVNASKPSMLIGELKNTFSGNRHSYMTMVDYANDGNEVFLSDGQAIDLTNQPHVFFVPPATY